MHYINYLLTYMLKLPVSSEENSKAKSGQWSVEMEKYICDVKIWLLNDFTWHSRQNMNTPNVKFVNIIITITTTFQNGSSHFHEH